MRAAVCRAFGEPLSIEEVELAAIAPGEVRVRLAAVAVCHSDIAYANGDWAGPLPAVHGHEAAGVVAEVGAGVVDVTLGDHVVVTPIRTCSECRNCLRGNHVGCTATWPRDEASPLRNGADPLHRPMPVAGFAEEVLVDHSQVVVIDDDIPLDAASLLACGVVTGVGAVTNTADVREGDTVVVVGCGGVGLNTVQGAVLVSARTIIAVDVNDDKVVAARSFGATHTVNAAKTDVAREVAAVTGGAMADHVFVTVGAKQAFDDALAFLAPFGTVVLVGMAPDGVTSQYDPTTLATLSQQIRGSKMGNTVIARDIPWLIDAYRTGRLELDGLITHRFPLDQINRAIAEVEAGDAIRNVIVFDG